MLKPIDATELEKVQPFLVEFLYNPLALSSAVFVNFWSMAFLSFVIITF